MALPVAALTAVYPGQATDRETLFFQFAPASLRKRIVPRYGISQPLFGSHEVAHYRGTNSMRIPLELFYTVIGTAQGVRFPNLQIGIADTPLSNVQSPGGLATEDFTLQGNGFDIRIPAEAIRKAEISSGSEGLKGPERFLEGLCYNDPKNDMQSPPFVIFNWPNVMRIVGRVEELEIEYQQFASEDLRATVMLATLTLREDPQQRILQSVVRTNGDFRADAELLAAAKGRKAPAQAATQSVQARLPLGGGG